MKFQAASNKISQVDSDLLVVGLHSGDSLEAQFKRLDSAFPKRLLDGLLRFAKQEGFQGKVNQVLKAPTGGELPAASIELIGLGAKSDFSPTLLRRALANTARRNMQSNQLRKVTISLPLTQSSEGGKKQAKRAQNQDHGEEFLRAAVEGFLLGGYAFHKYKTTSGKPPQALDSLTFVGTGLSPAAFSKAVKCGRSIAEATNLARTWIAEPPAYMTPTRLAEEAKKVALAAGLEIKILDPAQIAKLGMGSFLGVARGAKEPCRFIVMEYKASKPGKKLAIVGKGITFDSGGLSLKPPVSQEHMKYDMSGAACVIATMKVVGELKPDVSVLGVVAASENMPGGAAMHPGDVLKAMNGKTIEVNNTDAEGRLVLADALYYSAKNGADEMIDVATLTGAVVTALGRAAAGIMGNNQKLIDNLITCGNAAGERFWQLPLFDEYKEYLKSDIADLKNAGSRGEAGSSAGAIFLKEFVDDKPWAHLDIAGPGWLEKDKDENNKGGTAFGVRALSYYILSLV